MPRHWSNTIFTCIPRFFVMSPIHALKEKVLDFLTNTPRFGYYAAYTREQILSAQLPRTDITERIMKGFHPQRSGDIVLVPRPYSVHTDLKKNKYVSSHGSPYHYDASVPLLLAGPAIRAGKILDPVSSLDIAPTVSYLLGILGPSGSEGRIIKDALE
jgi:hypothetical protein